MSEPIFKTQPKFRRSGGVRQRQSVMPDNRKTVRESRALADVRAAPMQLAKTSNVTGLPENLKQGIESLSGMSMDGVNVHYNSSKPAQLNAHAYAQGTDIHLAPGQEKHLPHEAWHVVQQAQGRVRPTMQMKRGVPVNDDKGLEHEATRMGQSALSIGEQMIPAGRQGEERHGMVLPTSAAANRVPGFARRPLQRLGALVQRLKHGFDLVEESDNEFKEKFIAWVSNESAPPGFTITAYDQYLILKHAEALAFSPEEIRRLSRGRYGTKAALIEKFKEIADFRDEPVETVKEDVAGIRHHKRQKPNVKRTALLGTYVRRRPSGRHVSGTLGKFVEDAPAPEKVESRREKWLRVPDEDWSALVNAEWVGAMSSHGHDFKIVSPMSEQQKSIIRAAFKSRKSGNGFLTGLRDTYYDQSVRQSKNPLWDDTRDDHEADAPSTLAYEIAGLLDSGRSELDPLYEDRKGLLKTRKRQYGRNEARKQHMENIAHKDFLTIQAFEEFCIDPIENLIERRSMGDRRVLDTVKAVRLAHYPRVRALWSEAAAVARHPNFKIFLSKRKPLKAALLAWWRDLDRCLASQPQVKERSRPFFVRILGEARQALQGFDTSAWNRFMKD